MSAAAQAVLVDSLPFFTNDNSDRGAEETVRNLAHDLRQPLSSIEAIAYYLEMTLPTHQQAARQYMRKLQQLVEQSNAILEVAQVAQTSVCGIPRRPPGRA